MTNTPKVICQTCQDSGFVYSEGRWMPPLSKKYVQVRRLELKQSYCSENCAAAQANRERYGDESPKYVLR